MWGKLQFFMIVDGVANVILTSTMLQFLMDVDGVVNIIMTIETFCDLHLCGIILSWIFVFLGVFQAWCKTLVVGETKKYVQQACAKWTDWFQYEDLKIVDLDEPGDPAPQVVLPTMATWRPTIVTGFSRNHLRVGLLLLRSVGKAASNPIVSKHYNVSFVVWVMEEFNSSETKSFDCTVQELRDVYHINVEVRKPNLTKYPVWMRINPSRFNINEGGRGGWIYSFGEHGWFVSSTRSLSQTNQSIGLVQHFPSFLPIMWIHISKPYIVWFCFVLNFLLCRGVCVEGYLHTYNTSQEGFCVMVRWWGADCESFSTVEHTELGESLWVCIQEIWRQG